MINNFNFIFKCKEYGVDQKDTTTHEEHIILSNKEKGLLQQVFRRCPGSPRHTVGQVHEPGHYRG